MAEVRKSHIHGIGVFAKRTIRKGEVICVYGGIVVPTSEIMEYRKKQGHAGIQVDEKFFLCPVMETYFEPFKCRCGSSGCRKTIRPTDWRIPEIQRKYGRYFSPYLQKKFLK